MATRLPLRSAIFVMPKSLRTKNGVRSAWAAVMMRRSFCAPIESISDFHDVRNAEVGLGPADHGNNDLVACGRLHEHIEPGFFLEHFCDSRRTSCD